LGGENNEDSLFISQGKLAESNAQQVTKIRQIVEDLGRQVVTPDELHKVLDPKGGDNVVFQKMIILCIVERGKSTCALYRNKCKIKVYFQIVIFYRARYLKTSRKSLS